MDNQYAFGGMDKHGKLDLGSFAAQAEHRAELDFRPSEGRVYFTRKAKSACPPPDPARTIHFHTDMLD
jgi:hypothetical protein